MTTTQEHAASSAEAAPEPVGSFSNIWQRDEASSSHTWDSDEELIGNIVAGGRGMPIIRFFDFFTGRSVGFTGAVKLYEHALVRVYAQNPAARDPYLSRFANFDAIYFQYAGHSTIETEYGAFELAPCHAIVIPAGVAHRTIADKDTLRLAILSKDPAYGAMLNDPAAHAAHCEPGQPGPNSSLTSFSGGAAPAPTDLPTDFVGT